MLFVILFAPIEKENHNFLYNIIYINIYIFVIIAGTCKEDIIFLKYITNELWEEKICCLLMIQGFASKVSKNEIETQVSRLTQQMDMMATSKKLQVKPPSSGQETNRLHRIKLIIVMSSNMNMRHFLVTMMSSPQFPSCLLSHCTSQISQSSGVNLWSFTFQDASISAW